MLEERNFLRILIGQKFSFDKNRIKNDRGLFFHSEATSVFSTQISYMTGKSFIQHSGFYYFYIKFVDCTIKRKCPEKIFVTIKFCKLVVEFI